MRAVRDEAEAAVGQSPLQPPVPGLHALDDPQPTPPGSPTAVTPTPLPIGHADGMTNWETIRLGWRDIRDRMELAIEDIPNAQVRSKYSRIARYVYQFVINALQKDGVIAPAQVAERWMDKTFNILKFKLRTVSADDVAKFTRALEFVDHHLPKLPN